MMYSDSKATKIIDIIKSKKTSAYILYGIAISMVIDIFLTYYILTSIIGSSEKNLTAYYFMDVFGILPGMIILSTLTMILLILLGITLEVLIPVILRKEKEDCIYISNGIWIAVLLFVFIKSFMAIVNNMWVLLNSF